MLSILKPSGPGWNYYSVVAGRPPGERRRMLLNAAGLPGCGIQRRRGSRGRFVGLRRRPAWQAFTDGGYVVASAEDLWTELADEHLAALSVDDLADVDYHRPNGLVTCSSTGSTERRQEMPCRRYARTAARTGLHTGQHVALLLRCATDRFEGANVQSVSAVAGFVDMAHAVEDGSSITYRCLDAVSGGATTSGMTTRSGRCNLRPDIGTSALRSSGMSLRLRAMQCSTGCVWDCSCAE